MLDNKGYPFKSKEHSAIVHSYQYSGHCKWVDRYINRGLPYGCPDHLKYQFNENFNIKISDKCCTELKEKPLRKWQKKNNKQVVITGMMRSEGGRRSNINCVLMKNNEIVKFHPLAVLSEEWEEWFIKTFNIKLCSLYYPPYNFKRTRCKGCPFNPKLEDDLKTLEDFFPNERKQCEMIWKPVYDEYRRIGYRLKEDKKNGKS